MKTKVENLLKSVLPSKAVIILKERKQLFAPSEDYKCLHIAFATSSHEIHNVSGQLPEIVSLYLD